MNPANLPPDQVRQIPHWTRSYAQNRSLPVLVILVVMVLICSGLGYFAHLTGQAYRAGRTLPFSLYAAATATCLAGVALLSIPRVWRRFQGPLIRRLYRNDGSVSVRPPTHFPRAGRWLWFYAFPALFALCTLALVLIGPRIGARYQQPLSALFCVPFMLALAFYNRPVGTLMIGLWASLYALHAILILAGAPILLQGWWSSFNISLPMFAYGILSALVSHLYSRYALRRLKRFGASQA